MTLTKLLGIPVLMLPLLSHAVPVELKAEPGMYLSCPIKTPNADNAITGSLRLVTTSSHPQWAPMVAILFLDADEKPLYRFGVIAERDSGRFSAYQAFASASEESATELFGTVPAGDAVPIQMKWSPRGWILAGVADSGLRSLSFSRKPARALVIVSGATAHVDLHDPATLDCDATTTIATDLVGSWHGTDSTGTQALLRLDADGYASLTMDGQTWGGHAASGGSLRYQVDQGKSPMWIDFFAVNPNGKEVGRLLWTIERISATSLRVRAGAKPDERPDPTDPASTKFTATLEKSSEP
jgi:hypothetical protein